MGSNKRWCGHGRLAHQVSAILFKQVPDLPAVVGMTLIVTGVVVINVFSKTAGH